MKKKSVLKLIIVICIIAISAILVFYYYNNINSSKTINIEDVKSVSLYPLRAGHSDKVYNYETKASDDMKLIDNIVNYIKSGKFVGTKESLVISQGSQYPTIVLELTDGETMEIQMEGAGIGQVLIKESSKHKIYKVYSPELRKLFTDELKYRFNS